MWVAFLLKGKVGSVKEKGKTGGGSGEKGLRHPPPIQGRGCDGAAICPAHSLFLPQSLQDSLFCPLKATFSLPKPTLSSPQQGVSEPCTQSLLVQQGKRNPKPRSENAPAWPSYHPPEKGVGEPMSLLIEKGAPQSAPCRGTRPPLLPCEGWRPVLPGKRGDP